jgi:hypothetical protein
MGNEGNGNRRMEMKETEIRKWGSLCLPPLVHCYIVWICVPLDEITIFNWQSPTNNKGYTDIRCPLHIII